ncbi:cell adhesion molecule DSCAML1-like [Centruroides vittatus]|uniref:cell adhesion molecule DSCAML1-like n=1 Tax=Centruroides vittatus TaxID=120091 RepID=UPI00351043E6
MERILNQSFFVCCLYLWMCFHISPITMEANILSAVVPPKIVPQVSENNLREGQRYMAICSIAEGDPPLTFQWSKNGKTLKESSHLTIRRQDDFSTSLIIASVKGSDSGNYTCLVSNRAGSDSLVTKLFVSVPPAWIRQPYDVSVKAGNKLVLHCEATGYPPPSVKWRKTKGFSIAQSSPVTESHWKIIDSGTITSVTAKKEDEGFYTCEVGNGVGENLSKTVRVEVQVPPTVNVESVQKTVRNGEDSILVCNITGDKPLNIYWTKDGNKPEDNQRIQIVHTNFERSYKSVLNIESTNREDSGLYVCSANNTFGHSQMAIRLGIVEPPSQPEELKVKTIWSRSVRLSWLQPYNGNTAIKKYICTYKKEDKNNPLELKVDGSQMSVIVLRLKPYTKYQFQVVAVNEVGSSKPSKTVEAVTTEEEPASPAFDLQVSEKSTASAVLTWKSPPKHQWNGPLLGFYIGYKKTSQGSQISYSYRNVKIDSKTEIQKTVLDNLQKTSTYTVNVIAYNRAGLAPPSEPILLTTSYIESPPTPRISILTTDSNSVTMRILWSSKRNTPLTGYVAHIKPTNGQWQMVRLPLSPNNNYTIGGLVSGVQYQMYLTAKNEYGDSGPTEVLSFLTANKKADDEPLYQQLSFTLPVVVSLVIIIILPLVSCCCMHKLDRPFLEPEGVEARGFTYTAATPTQRPDLVTTGMVRSLPRAPFPAPTPAPPPVAIPASTPVQNQSTYSALHTYGSEADYDDPRYDSVMEEMKNFLGANAISVLTVPPKIVPQISESNLKESQRYIAMCGVNEGDPPFNFQWSKNGKPLTESSHLIVQRQDFSSSLIIASVKSADSGNYTCLVTNRVGSDSLTTKLLVSVPPSWIRQPYDVSVKAGNKLVLQCESDGYPVPTVKWRRTKGFSIAQSSPVTENHWKIIDSGTMSTVAAKKDDEGFYTCEVSNGIGENLSKTVRVEVQVPPTVNIESVQKMVKNGEDSLLVCNITGDKPLNIYWTKDGNKPEDNQRIQIVHTNFERSYKSVLNIESTNREDSGLYVCSANNTFGHSQMAIRLGIIEPPSQPEELKVKTIWSRSVRLSWLQPYNGNTVIQKYICIYKKEDKNTQLELKVDGSQMSVIILRLKPYTRYDFQVVAVNEVGSSKPSKTVIAITTEEVPPKIVPQISENNLKEGQTYIAMCGINEGDPPLTFQWSKNGKPLTESSHWVIHRQGDFSSSLIIASVKSADSGNYTCLVTNKAGSDSLTTKLLVSVPPTWIRQPYDVSIKAGNKLVLHCEADGYPIPTVKWRRTKGFSIAQSSPVTENHWKIIDSGTMSTVAAKKDDEGFYTCEVSNGIGENLSKTVRVEVQVPPTVNVESVQKMIRNGEDSILVCNITGDKPLNIYWTKDGKKPEDNQRIQIVHTNFERSYKSVLNIESTNREDSGLYVCSANNTFGHSQMAIRLGIVEPPSQPEELKVKSVWSRSVRLSWLQPYNGNTAIQKYICIYKKEGKDNPLELKIDGSQMSVIVLRLKPFTKYQFQVVAINEVGSSKPSKIVEAITSEEEPTSPAFDLQVSEKSTASAVLSWKSPSRQQWNGLLLGFYIGYKKTSQGSHISYSYKNVKMDHKHEFQRAKLDNLQKTSTYTVIVIAYNRAGLGPPSEPILITTSYVESPPTPRISILTTDSNSVTMRILWSSKRNTPLTGYVAHIKPTNGQWQMVRLPLSPNHNYTIGGLVGGVQYQMYLTAKNKYGDSGPTEVLSFLTANKKNDDEPLYQQLSFTLPVVVSLVIIVILPLVSCCCMHKLDRPLLEPEGVEARGFTYTAATPTQRPDLVTTGMVRSLPRAPVPAPTPAPPPAPIPASTPVQNQSTYSALHTYGSEADYDDPRYDSVVEEMKNFLGVNAMNRKTTL